MRKQSALKIMCRLIVLIKPLIGFMCLAVLLGVLGFLCSTFITILAAEALSLLLGFECGFSLNTLLTVMVVISLARGFLRYGEQSCNHYIAFKLLAIIRDKVFGALRRLTPAKLEGKDKGNLISLITSDIELLEVFYAHTISPICIALIMSVIMTAFMWQFHMAYGLTAAAAYIFVGVILPITVAKTSGNLGSEYREEAGALSSFVLESLRGLSEIMQYNQGSRRLEQLNEKSINMSVTESKMKERQAVTAGINGAAVLVFSLIVLLIGVHLYQNGIITFEAMLIPFVSMISSFGPVIALANLGVSLQSTIASGDRVLSLLDEEPAVKDIVGGEDIAFTDAQMDDVTFAYEEEEVLKNFSLCVPEHKIIGLVGKSGSGKSTALKLLMRFWECGSGVVKINGKNINDINTKSLRDNESYVTQETYLFHDTIANNLRIAKPDASQEELEEACKKASIHEFIMSLPDGYESKVGELGDTLSGGEKQRLGVARAFLHDAPLILLDEPTSSLDSLNEAVILKSLLQERENKTIVLVSHRESSMKIADESFQVDGGRMS